MSIKAAGVVYSDTIILSPSESLKVCDNFKDDLCEDIRHRIRQQNQDFTLSLNDDIYNQSLILIENKLIKR